MKQKGQKTEHEFRVLIQTRLYDQPWDTRVILRKFSPRDVTRKLRRIAVADALIFPWDQFPKEWGISRGAHHHLIIDNISGTGRLVVRDLMGRDLYEIPCSIWDLGPRFAMEVSAKLSEWA